MALLTPVMVDEVSIGDDEVFMIAQGTEEDTEFDEIIEVLQNLLLEPEFVDLQSSFCKQNCEHFEDSEENKLIYTTLFEKYTTIIENYLEHQLEEKIPGFSMSKFNSILPDRKDEIPDDIFDVLTSCVDFQEFKALMLSYKHTAHRFEGDGIQK